MKAYVGEGEFIKDKINTKGGIVGCRIPHLQDLMKYICKNGFEHHVCFTRGHVADVLEEAFSTYMEIEVYRA
jgi:L-fucose isomerase-like protein